MLLYKVFYRHPLIVVLLLCTLIIIEAKSTYINLDLFVNNRGASGPGSNFDGTGNYFDCPLLQNTTKLVTVGNINFHRTISSHHPYDNILCRGQTLALQNKPYGALYLLTGVNHGPITTDITLVYQDGSQSTTTLNLPDWQVSYTKQIHRLDHTDCKLNNGVQGTLVLVPLLVDPSKNVSRIVLPHNNPLGWFTPALHIFSMTGLSVTFGVTVVHAKGTHRWWEGQQHFMEQKRHRHYRQEQLAFDPKSKLYQIVTVRVHNTSPNWMENMSVFVKGKLVKTQYHGIVKRLAPGQIINVDVAIRTIRKGRAATQVEIEVLDTFGKAVSETTTIDNVEIGLLDTFEDTETSLHEHSVPTWYESAKFGIFIHWGVYSVPSWAPIGADYAEWYWWNYNQKYSATYNYHRSFYGPDFEYDHFIQAWKPDQFNPRTWIDLVDASRAKYFVFTSKHHDGIALFDTNVTDRSSVKMNPYRNFLKDLLDEAKRSYPWLKRGIYFSLPEWYHPSYHDSSINWNGPPVNPYTSKTVAYTGASQVSSFVNEVQVPQFLELIHQYEPDIMWCDIGGINNSTFWQADFLNHAKKQGRQVTINDRCGNSVSDFATVEYSSVDYVPSRFWESTRGIDPHSFGFNHQTQPHQYASVVSLLQDLVSVVSKGGNFLLNIGPEASGHIPLVMSRTLRTMGVWIDKVEESIFDTIPYWVTSNDFFEPGQPLYFMQSKDGQTFYIFSFERPLGERLVIRTTIPLHSQSRISLMTMEKPEFLDWRIFSNGRLIVTVPNHVLDQEELLWVFKVEAP